MWNRNQQCGCYLIGEAEIAEQESRVGSGKEIKDALDYVCDSLDHVASGIGQLVHAWWVHPHPVDFCRGTTSDQSHSGTETLVAVSA